MGKQKNNLTSGSSNLGAKLKSLSRTQKLLILLVLVLIFAGLYFLWNNNSNNNSKTKSLNGETQSNMANGAASSASNTISNSQTPASSTGNKTSANSSSSPTKSPTSPSSSSSSSTGSSSSGGTSGSSGGGTGTPAPAQLTSTSVASLDGSSSNPNAACGQSSTFNFSGSIYADGAGTVTYHWYVTDKGDLGTSSLTFATAGSKTVTTAVTYNGTDYSPGSYPMTMRLETLTPNANSKLKNFTFTSTCN